MEKVEQILDYVATQPDAIITYQASEMVLAAHSDTSYLSKTKPSRRTNLYPPNNGVVLTIAQMINAVMSLAAEAEIGAVYITSCNTIPTRHTLKDMGHPQPPTPMKTDYTTVLGVVTNTIHPKCIKAMHMHFHRLRRRMLQKKLWNYWRAGPTNKGDYAMKHHAAEHHCSVQPYFLTPTAVYSD